MSASESLARVDMTPSSDGRGARTGGAAGCARERGGGSGGGRGGAFTVEVMFARAAAGFNGGLADTPRRGPGRGEEGRTDGSPLLPVLLSGTPRPRGGAAW